MDTPETFAGGKDRKEKSIKGEKPVGAGADQIAINESMLEEIADRYGLELRQILDGGKEINHDPALMDWVRLLQPTLPRDVCIHWGRCIKYWLAHRGEWIRFFRATLNSYDTPIENLKAEVKELLRLADSTIAVFLQELLPDNPDLQKRLMPSQEVLECNDIMKLICCAVYGDFNRTRKTFPRSSDKKRKLLAWEARKKIALALLHRSIQQEPKFVNRKEDSSYFENHMLRDKTGLISPLENYKPARVIFKIEDEKSEAMEVIDPEAPGEGFEMPGHESAVLYKFDMYGRPTPDRKPEIITVYAFAGNKNEIDSQNPMLSAREKEELNERKTIINYKSPESIALKRLRGRLIQDYVRCTFLVCDQETLEILQGIISTQLGSSVNRVKHGRSTANKASSNSYEALQVTEDLHNERASPPRNFHIEIRMGLLESVIWDKSKNHSASHAEYKKRRAESIKERLFPPKLYQI